MKCMGKGLTGRFLDGNYERGMASNQLDTHVHKPRVGVVNSERHPMQV